MIFAASVATAQNHTCALTTFMGGNSAPPRSTVFFDVTVTEATTFEGLMTNTSTIGAIGMTIYTNGNGTSQSAVSPDGVVTLTLGAATIRQLSGSLLSPRVWNGQLCHTAPLGPNYCDPAVANSTGVAGAVGASGSVDLALNNLVLEATNLPNGSFGFFLTSQDQALVLNPGGSAGNLCLGGAVGRFVGPGEIKNSGTAGSFGLAVSNTMQPTPTGFVSITAGQTWNYQVWYRDVVSGAVGSNFTNALTLTFN